MHKDKDSIIFAEQIVPRSHLTGMNLFKQMKRTLGITMSSKKSSSPLIASRDRLKTSKISIKIYRKNSKSWRYFSDKLAKIHKCCLLRPNESGYQRNPQGKKTSQIERADPEKFQMPPLKVR